MAKSYGHNDEFGSLFVFLLQNAVRAGVYRNEDYEKNPKQFCGMEVDSNPIA
jgi:hypothetical protein